MIDLIDFFFKSTFRKFQRKFILKTENTNSVHQNMVIRLKIRKILKDKSMSKVDFSTIKFLKLIFNQNKFNYKKLIQMNLN